MKKYICLFCIALLAAACVDPLQPYSGPIFNEPEEGALVTLEFSLPPMTKSTMAHDPTISTIHVAVFNEAGILKQYEKATLTNPGNIKNGNNTTTVNGQTISNNPTYSVEVNMSATPRILHFIADSPIDTYDDLVAAAGTSGEDVILNALTTSDGATAYWQRVKLDKIDAYTYDGERYDGTNYSGGIVLEGSSDTYEDEYGNEIPVYKGDFIKRNGRKVLDGTGYFQSDYVAGKISNIPFIRNFAEITVSSTPPKTVNGVTTPTTNFTPLQFALVNVPKAGFVAPFDTKKGEFCSAYIGVEALTHDGVAATAYPGSLVSGIDDSAPESFINLSSSNKNAYMYERTIPNAQQPATCILVYGKYDPDNDGDYTDDDGAVRDAQNNTWFKIEISDDKGGYFPIYRGLSYNVQIGEITGSGGYSTAKDALDNNPVGDVSGSTSTTTLEEISDGKGTTLRVQYMDYVATEKEPKTIFYTMYYKAAGATTPTYLTEDVELTVHHDDPNKKAIDANEGTVVAGARYSGTGTPDDNLEWYVATVNLIGSGTDGVPGSTATFSTLHVEGETPSATGSKKMYRDVKYHVLGTQHFQNGQNVLKGTPLKTEEKGEETTLTIYLPSDLGMSMFPLVLRIEAENGNFTSDNLPVESGPSLFNEEGESKNAFYFLKTIDYTEYCSNTTKAFTAIFKTTRHGSTSVTGTNATNFRVLDKVKAGRDNPYFAYAECYVSVGGPVFELLYNGAAANSASVKADVISVSFDIRSTGDENPTWTLTPSNNITSLSSVPSFTTNYSGTGNATITVNFPANSTSEPVPFTVTASRTGFPDQTFEITQQGVTRKYYTINLNPLNTYDWGEGLSNNNPDNNTYFCYRSQGNYNIHSSSGGLFQPAVVSIATMSVTIYGYTEFTIYIRSYAESSYDYVVVRKLDGTALTSSWVAGTAHSDNGTKADAHTRGRQSNNTSIVTGNTYLGYRAVTFTTEDGLTEDDTPHTFYIQYGKDTSTNSNDDRGYVLIPKEYTFVSQ